MVQGVVIAILKTKVTRKTMVQQVPQKSADTSSKAAARMVITAVFSIRMMEYVSRSALLNRQQLERKMTCRFANIGSGTAVKGGPRATTAILVQAVVLWMNALASTFLQFEDAYMANTVGSLTMSVTFQMLSLSRRKKQLKRATCPFLRSRQVLMD